MFHYRILKREKKKSINEGLGIEQFYTLEQNNLPLIFSIWGLSSFNSEPLKVTGILSIFKFWIKNSSTAAVIEEFANL